MEEKVQKEDGISLLDILHLLLSKIKLLILVVLIGGLFGGAFAVWRNIDVKIYGTEVQFYVNPEKPKDTTGSESSQYGVYGAYGKHVMDNMIKLLSSESFAEQLILDKKPADITLEEWQKTTEYKTELGKYAQHVSYSYLESNTTMEDADSLARSFIYVKISVLNDEELAKEIYRQVVTIVPEYVEANMPVPSDYQGTNCQRISRTDEVHLKNPNQTVNQAIKYAVLVAIAALVVACVVVIIVDQSDKTVRDEETIARMFDVPVLGLIPTVDSLVEQTNLKKAEKRRQKRQRTKAKAKPAKPTPEKVSESAPAPTAESAPEVKPKSKTESAPKGVAKDQAQRQNKLARKQKNKQGNRR